MKLPYLIAEIGVNFFDTAKVEKISPLEAAKKFIQEAKRSGVNAVKFQAYKANTLASKYSPAYWDTSKETTKSQFELFSKFDSFGQSEFEELSRYAHSIGVDFLCTPFDLDSVDYLSPLCNIFKISSSDLSNLNFIRYIAKKQKPIYLSVGASYLSEIDEVVRILEHENCPDIVLMHCVLSYPTLNNNANLASIKALKRIYPNLRIGYSDHTLPDKNMQILSTAYLYGAEVIEKHFTLDKTLPGNDHYHAGDPTDFQKAVNNFKLIQEITGTEDITVLPCEKNSRREARRSLVLTRSIRAGEKIQASDLIAKRPGTGIPAKYQYLIEGKKINKDLPEDSILKWDDFFTAE